MPNDNLRLTTGDDQPPLPVTHAEAMALARLGQATSAFLHAVLAERPLAATMILEAINNGVQVIVSTEAPAGTTTVVLRHGDQIETILELSAAAANVTQFPGRRSA